MQNIFKSAEILSKNLLTINKICYLLIIFAINFINCSEDEMRKILIRSECFRAQAVNDLDPMVNIPDLQNSILLFNQDDWALGEILNSCVELRNKISKLSANIKRFSIKIFDNIYIHLHCNYLEVEDSPRYCFLNHFQNISLMINRKENSNILLARFELFLLREQKNIDDLINLYKNSKINLSPALIKFLSNTHRICIETSDPDLPPPYHDCEFII